MACLHALFSTLEWEWSGICCFRFLTPWLPCNDRCSTWNCEPINLFFLKLLLSKYFITSTGKQTKHFSFVLPSNHCRYFRGKFWNTFLGTHKGSIKNSMFLFGLFNLKNSIQLDINSLYCCTLSYMTYSLFICLSIETVDIYHPCLTHITGVGKASSGIQP